MPTENFVDELAIFSYKNKKQKHASFHPWHRILWETNAWGHWQVMGRDLGWAGVLKQIFCDLGTLCAIYLLVLSISQWLISIYLEGTFKKNPLGCAITRLFLVIVSQRAPLQLALAEASWCMGKPRKEKSKCQAMHYEMFMAWFIWEIHFIRQYFE